MPHKSLHTFSAKENACLTFFPLYVKRTYVGKEITLPYSPFSPCTNHSVACSLFSLSLSLLLRLLRLLSETCNTVNIIVLRCTFKFYYLPKVAAIFQQLSMHYTVLNCLLLLLLLPCHSRTSYKFNSHTKLNILAK